MTRRRDLREAGRRLREGAAARRAAITASCRSLVRIPSPSGDEEGAARHAVGEMLAHGLDEAAVDAWGNAVGILRADAPDPLPGAILLNAHLDHVDAGDPADWTHGPFDADIVDGLLFGRGSTDTKAAVAGQIHAAALLKNLASREGFRRRRDLVVAAVVQEEVGGLGTAGLLESGIAFHAAVVGEPSQGALAFGHRGRVEVEITFHGRAAHASTPDRGANPHPALAAFIPLLDDLAHDDDARFGRSTVAPTLVHARPSSANVIPSDLVLVLDWRNVASETAEIVRGRIERAAERSRVPGISVRVRTPTRLMTSWTGEAREVERVSRPFSTDPDGALFSCLRASLAEGLGRDVEAIAWDFASDAGWIAGAGIPCVGYGPGDMRAMHVVDESVALDLVVESAAGYALLALALDAAPDRAA